jgi:hypothetical protein
MLRRSISVTLLGVVCLAGRGTSHADTPRVAAREVTVAAPAFEARQHRMAPVHEGDRRSFNVTGRDGAIATAATLSERVTSLSLRGDVLRAEIAATWLATGGHAMTGYSARRVEEVDRDGVVRATNRLDRAPIPGSAIEGVALPRNLHVGRSWTVLLTYRDAGREVSSRIRGHVAGKVLRSAPDGRVLPGVLIEWTEVRSSTGRKHGAVERWSGSSVYLEGVGELETRMKRAGSGAWFQRRLASFQPGAH